ncbi:uncharacterized protein MICPUCDRAFT_47961, partial [Micromonas pusilla CCMP1545]
ARARIPHRRTHFSQNGSRSLSLRQAHGPVLWPVRRDDDVQPDEVLGPERPRDDPVLHARPRRQHHARGLLRANGRTRIPHDRARAQARGERILLREADDGVPRRRSPVVLQALDVRRGRQESRPAVDAVGVAAAVRRERSLRGVGISHALRGQEEEELNRVRWNNL